MPAYERFAHIYDKIGSDVFSQKMFHYTQRLLTRLRYHPKSVLELACGTGTAAVMWTKNNVKTFAIDGSEDMLEIARIKAGEAGAKIHFSHQPLKNFAIPEKVDLVTCFFDSLNYLLSVSELMQCFRCVRRSLPEGGYFIFDVNTPEAMKTIWDDQVYADENEDIAWIWKNVYFPRIKQAEVRATFFVRQGKTWERFDEIHTERGYGTTEIKKALKSTGFKTIKFYDCLKFSRPDRRATRIAVIAQAK